MDDITSNPLPIDPDLGEAAVYPVPEDKRLGVSTDLATPPEATDQGDEEVTREQTGIPD